MPTYSDGSTPAASNIRAVNFPWPANAGWVALARG
jgi:hypothetical protein